MKTRNKKGQFVKGHKPLNTSKPLSENVCLHCQETFYSYASQKRKFCSQECHYNSREKLYVGEKSSNWQGGKKKDNLRERTWRDYHLWRKLVLERDNYECRRCQTKENLHTHHLLHYAKEPEFRRDVPNGITLCRECHSLVHQTEEIEKELLFEVLVVN